MSAILKKHQPRQIGESELVYLAGLNFSASQRAAYSQRVNAIRRRLDRYLINLFAKSQKVRRS